MKVLIAVLCFILLAGCVPIVKQFAPSLDYCDEVSYQRKGGQFTVMANCRL
jgi:hypothetical protein